MSDADTEGDITVSTGDVAVTKTYEPDRFPVPAMAFGIRSDHAEATTVRVIESVPDAVSTDDLGFHPEYGSEHWSIEDGRAVFEREFGAGEEYLTVYGIRNVDQDHIDLFMTDPTLEAAGESTAGGDAETEASPTPAARTEPDRANPDRTESASADTDAATADATTDADPSGQATGSEATTDPSGGTPTDEPDDAAETGDGSRGPGAMGGGATSADADATGRADTGGDTQTDATTTESTPTGAGSDSAEPTIGAGGVAAALAAELRAGEIDTEDREVLADELSQMDQGVDVRIKHLQSEVSDLAAYSDALGEFIEENGPARELLDDLTTTIGDLEDEVGDHDDRIEDAESDLDAVAGRTDEAEAAIGDLEDRASEHDDRIEDLDDRTETNAADLDALDDRLSGADERIESLEADLSDVEGDTAAAHEEIEALNEELADLQAWRSQISEVLGGVSDDA